MAPEVKPDRGLQESEGRFKKLLFANFLETIFISNRFFGFLEEKRTQHLIEENFGLLKECRLTTNHLRSELLLT
jgi:hypothetical protein